MSTGVGVTDDKEYRMDRHQGHLPDDAMAMAIVQAERHQVGIWEDLNSRQIRQIRRVIRADQRGRYTYDEVRDRLHQIARDHTTGDHRWIREGLR